MSIGSSDFMFVKFSGIQIHCIKSTGKIRRFLDWRNREPFIESCRPKADVMEALKRQENHLKSQLEDAGSIAERRTIRGELREIRRKIQEFDMTKTDENSNEIGQTEKSTMTKSKFESSLQKDSKVVTRNATNDAKTIDSNNNTNTINNNRETKSESKKVDHEYKIIDNTVDLKVKSPDERANRRAKRQERMARLEKEMTEGTNTEISSGKSVTKNEAKEVKTEEKNISQANKDKPKDTWRSSKYESKIDVEKDEKSASRKSLTDKSIGLKVVPKNDAGSKEVSAGMKNENKTATTTVTATTTTPVDAPKSYTKTIERKEERTTYQDGMKSAAKKTTEEKSVITNGEKTTYSTRTNSRVASAFNKFGDTTKPIQNDKARAAKTVGSALGNLSSIRNRFATAEKEAPTKPVEVGLNFAKETGGNAVKVRKYTEVKVEQKTTSSKPAEFGLSFIPEKGQQQQGARSNLKETSIGSQYKKTNPVPHPRHQTAPAAPGAELNFSMPSGGSKASSVADRMKFFREAQAKEKAQADKQKAQEKDRVSRLSSAPGSTTSLSSTENRTAPCLKKRDVKKPVRRTMSISSIVLDWCREMVKDYGIEIKNFSGSWSNGLAFCALIHKFNPDTFDFKELDSVNRERNFKLAFDTAFEVKKIPKLLDVEDMVRMAKPEPRSVQCYVQWIWSVYGPTSGYGPSQEEIKKAAVG
eukprot:gene5434-6113_t